MISTLSQLIAQAESSNNPFAIRHEPTHQPADAFISAMAVATKCNDETALTLCQCSWGLYQIMGDELMAKGLNVSPLQFCNNAAQQLAYFNLVLIEKGLSSYTLQDILTNATDRLHFASLYNGPGEPATYAQYLLDTYVKAS